MSGAFYMDAVIKPNRSLSQRGVIVLIGVITAANCMSALMWLRIGANVVPFFLGADVLAVVVAFAASFHSGRQVERVQVSAYDIRITRETPKASAVVWESPTAFTRVNVEKDEEDGRVIACRLSLSGRETAVAAALSPKERAAFAQALETAIWRAKRGEAIA
jgi:uncharacterized membrane protein